MATEDNATEGTNQCHSIDEEPIKSASIISARQTSEDNKVKSPLMRLPNEIRVKILRMVVGDKLIHIYAHEKVYDELSPQEQAEWQSGMRHWTVVRKVCIDDYYSKGVPDDYCRDYDVYCMDYDEYRMNYRWGNHFDILNASHQLHREAFPLFWRTCQFGFDEGKVLERFLDRLGEDQKASLRRLVIMSASYSRYDDWNFEDPGGLRLSGYTRQAEDFPLKTVCDLMLHLDVGGSAAQVLQRFELFEPLRLLALKEAKVVFSYPDMCWPSLRARIMGKKMARLEDTLSKRLLDPTVTKADVVDALTKKLTRLERLEMEAQTGAERNLHQAESHQRSVEEHQEAAELCQTEAGAKRAEIDELQAALQKDDMKEMERLAEP